jgi:hypothetical protein
MVDVEHNATWTVDKTKFAGWKLRQQQGWDEDDKDYEEFRAWKRAKTMTQRATSDQGIQAGNETDEPGQSSTREQQPIGEDAQRPMGEDSDDASQKLGAMQIDA